MRSYISHPRSGTPKGTTTPPMRDGARRESQQTTPKTDNPDNLAQWEWWLRHSFVSPSLFITKSPAAIITRSIRGERKRGGGTRIRWMVRYYVSISKRRIFTVIAIGSRCQEYSNNEWWTKINGIRVISYSWRSPLLIVSKLTWSVTRDLSKNFNGES